MSDLERRVTFSPAYDKRAPDSAKNYGIGAMRGCFYLIGDEGAVQFVIGTNWYLPHVHAELEARHYSGITEGPRAWDLGYHSRAQTPSGTRMEKCDLWEGGCWYDGSSLNAKPILGHFLEEGDEAVWKALAGYYAQCFGVPA